MRDLEDFHPGMRVMLKRILNDPLTTNKDRYIAVVKGIEGNSVVVTYPHHRTISPMQRFFYQPDSLEVEYDNS